VHDAIRCAEAQAFSLAWVRLQYGGRVAGGTDPAPGYTQARTHASVAHPQERSAAMSIVAWIIVRRASGFASKIIDGRGRGLALDVILGVAGPSWAASCFAWSARPASRASTD
jgi:hypothetical protein